MASGDEPRVSGASQAGDPSSEDAGGGFSASGGPDERGGGPNAPGPPAVPGRLDAAWLKSRTARTVTDALTAGGARAWFVGGCVRNELMGRPVEDLDLCTDAEPQEVVRLLDAAGIRHIPTGIEHGTVTAVAGSRPFEITTLRRDVTTDGRRAQVAFGVDIAQDAARRDFTINALYADPAGNLLDPLGGGVDDVARRRVRFIGDARARIREDFLRILRFFRFHALYGDPSGGIDAEGLAACAAEIDGLDGLARERVGGEMRRLLGAEDPAPALAAMAACGALARILPGADAAAAAPLVAVEAMAGAPRPDWKRRLVVMGVGVEDAAMRLRLSRAEQRGLRAIADALSEEAPPAQAAYRHGAEAARDSALLRAASLGEPPPRRLMKEVARGAVAAFPVSAADLVARGAKPGPALGRKLAALETAWLESDFKLSRGDLLDG